MLVWSSAAGAWAAAPPGGVNSTNGRITAMTRRGILMPLERSADYRIFLERQHSMVRLGSRRRLRIELERKLQVFCLVARERDGVHVGIAGSAVSGAAALHGTGQTIQAEIRNAVGIHVLADLFERVRRGDQLGAPRRVYAIKAGRDGWRAADPHMDFPCSRAPNHANDLPAGGAANNGVVHKNDALSF